ncbi:MAG: proprotein convertase P-domain-containing protein, partial [Saprospiraceae bacterium]
MNRRFTKLLLSSGLLCLSLVLTAQTFTSNPGAAIPDNSCDVTNEFTLDLSGESLANLDAAFGLETVCLDISHSWVGDIGIAIIGPDDTYVELSVTNGGDDSDYTGTCFNMSGPDGPITSGSAPFTGTYIPEQNFGSINNGQNPNDVWTLLVCDLDVAPAGVLNSWSLTFGNSPAPPTCPSPATKPNTGANLILGNSCTSGDNTGVSEEAGEPEGSCFSGGTQNSVWYKVVGDGSLVTITTDFLGGTNDDTEVAVYSATDPVDYCTFSQEGCDQDSGVDEAFSSIVSFQSSVAETYYIQLSGYEGTEGTYCIAAFSELVPLPVELISFEGQALEKENILTWTTASEENTEWHIIERSIDGKNNWTEIGRTRAAGTSAAIQKYELMDQSPVANAYYRVKSLDFDARFEYSNVVNIQRE